MAKTVNNYSGDSSGAFIALAVVAVFGITVATILAFLAVFLMLGVAGGTAILGYKCYQLHVNKTIALAAIAANMPPPQPAPRALPSAHDIVWGRDREAH